MTQSNSIRMINRLGISLCLATCIWLFSGVSAYAATLSLSPNTGVYTAGGTFTTRLVVNTAGSAINAAEATLSFNPAELSVVSVSKGSTFGLWAVEPSFSNSAGTITFGGGSPAGYTGSNGTVLNITWRLKGAGTARVSFRNGSVLAADGRGTNVVRSLNGGTYTVAAAEVSPEPEVIEYVAPANTPSRPNITSSTHENDGWSQATTATLEWSLPSDVIAVRTLLDANSGSIPTRVYDNPISSITLDDLTDGVQYFHLQFQNAEGWGRVAHFRLAVATAAPDTVSLTRDEAYDLASPTQVMIVGYSTTTAPIVSYLVQIDGGEPASYEATASSTITLKDLEPRYHTVVVELIDAAGNSTLASDAFTIEAFTAPELTEYPTRLGETVIPVFKGTTRPDAVVTVTIGAVNGSQPDAVYVVTADIDGHFVVVPDGRFATGVYTLSASAVDTTGAQSAATEPVRFVVDRPGYIQVGAWLVSLLSVLVPLLLLAGGLVLLLLWFMVRGRKIRAYVVAETDEALDVLRAQFAALRKTVSDEQAKLAATRKTNKLTKSEELLIGEINQHIDTTEVTIRKEISDVDDVVR